MWIIVATVLLLYLLGFLFICFLNAEQSHGNPSTSDNNNTSSSASNNPSGDDESPSHSHPRFLFSRLFSSNFRRYCVRQQQHNQQSSHSQPSLSSSSNSQRQTSSTLAADPSRSALFAYRQQQLRQIHHEITEMSYLLGASQNDSGESRARSVPLAISLPCPLTNRLVRVQPLVRDNRYSFIHQLSVIPPDPAMMSSCSINMVGSGGSSGGIVIPYPYNVSCGGHSPSAGSGSPALSYSPGSTESCHIIRERQRRLRHIRMELEGLSLQLAHPTSDVSCSSSGMSASSSDSWILIALTILVVLLLFYLSKKMICNSTNGNGEDDAEASPVVSSSPSSSALESGGPSTSTSFSDYMSSPPNLVDGFSQDQEYPDGGDLSTERGSGNWSLGAGYYCHGNRCPYQHWPTRLPQSDNEASSISIIISRKDVLEGQLRTQLGRIVEAEKEIQRLVRLLRVEEGMDCSQCLANLPSPSSSPSPVASPVVEATVEESNSTTSTAPLENDVHNIPPPPSTSSTQPVDEPHHHHQNNVGETASPSSSSSLSSHSHRLYSESFPLLSNIIRHNNNPPGNNRGATTDIEEGQAGPSPEDFPFNSRPPHQQYHPCPCNLSRAAAGANYSRRMLMLQRMFLLPPGLIGRGNFLPRITSFLPYNDAQSYYHHYLLRDPQSHSHRHHHNHQQEHHQPPSSNNDDEPPPAYEECIKA